MPGDSVRPQGINFEPRGAVFPLRPASLSTTSPRVEATTSRAESIAKHQLSVGIAATGQRSSPLTNTAYLDRIEATLTTTPLDSPQPCRQHDKPLCEHPAPTTKQETDQTHLGHCTGDLSSCLSTGVSTATSGAARPSTSGHSSKPTAMSTTTRRSLYVPPGSIETERRCLQLATGAFEGDREPAGEMETPRALCTAHGTRRYALYTRYGHAASTGTSPLTDHRIGSKYERNLPAPNLERMLPAKPAFAFWSAVVFTDVLC